MLLGLTDSDVTDVAMRALMLGAKLAAPILVTTLAVGLLVGVLQSATQLQEPTIAFVPKFIAVGVVLLVSGNWMLSSMIDFTRELFRSLPSFLG